MKLIIEIPDHIYEMVINTGTFGCYRFDTRKAIKNGTPIPDNATNIDVMLAMLPDEIKLKVDCDKAEWWSDGCEGYKIDGKLVANCKKCTQQRENSLMGESLNYMD